MGKTKYSEQDMTKALLMVINQGLTYQQVCKLTGISQSVLFRYKDKYLKSQDTVEPIKLNKDVDIIVHSDAPVPLAELQQRVDDAMLKRAKFMNDLLDAKQAVLDKILVLAPLSASVDALQKTLKTLSDIDITKKGDPDLPPGAHVGMVNMFQFINQQLINENYEGPRLTDADIVEGNRS